MITASFMGRVEAERYSAGCCDDDDDDNDDEEEGALVRLMTVVGNCSLGASSFRWIRGDRFFTCTSGVCILPA